MLENRYYTCYCKYYVEVNKINIYVNLNRWIYTVYPEICKLPKFTTPDTLNYVHGVKTEIT